MKNENGYVLPATLLFIFLLFAFLLHQTNLLLTHQKFYNESYQLTLLDAIMQRAIVDAKHDLQINPTFSKQYTYPEGTADVESEYPTVKISCKTKQNRAYRASFQYNKETTKLSNWIEERDG